MKNNRREETYLENSCRVEKISQEQTVSNSGGTAKKQFLQSVEHLAHGKTLAKTLRYYQSEGESRGSAQRGGGGSVGVICDCFSWWSGQLRSYRLLL
jgi:hypothetical protein